MSFIKKPSVWLGFLLALSVLASVFIQQNQSNKARARRLISQPFITSLAPNSVVLVFATEKPVTSQIQISAPFIAKSRTLPISNTPKKLHQITLRDLRPATEYEYKIIIIDENNIKTISEKFSFKTP